MNQPSASINQRPIKVLLTGGTGYLGSHLLKILRQRGVHVTVLVRNQNATNLLQFRNDESLRIIKCDLLEVSSCLQRLLGSRFDSLIHCAALPKLGESNYRELFQSNVIIARNVAELAKKLIIPRFFHLSTAFVGPEASGCLLEKIPDPENCTNHYEQTKSLTERELVKSDLSNLEIFRPGIILPSAGSPKAVVDASPLGPFIRLLQLYQGRSIVLPANPKITPGFCHIDDVSSFIVGRLFHDPTSSAIWNIVSPERCNVYDVMEGFRASDICSEVSYDPTLERSPFQAWKEYLSFARTWDMKQTQTMANLMGVSLQSIEYEHIVKLARQYIRYQETLIA